jgi:AraC-like DNA-binding protein
LKAALHKSSIPPSQIFVIRHLVEKHFDPTWHAHSEYQLFVVLEGTGTRFIGDSIKSFRAGELILTGPHVPHVWRSDDIYFQGETALTTKGIVIYLNENFLGDYILEKEEMNAIKKLCTKSMRGLEFYGTGKLKVTEMMKELLGLRGIQSVIHLLQIFELLASTKEYHYISTKVYDDAIDQHESDRLNQVYQYTFQHFRKKIWIKDIAGLLHMTTTSFSRYFTMKNNKSYSRFVAEIRIKHACKLLTETDESISHICYESGFNTLSNFNKQFKEIMQKSPLQYKKEFMSL